MGHVLPVAPTMSGVATLKAGTKRGFDEMAIDIPPGPGCSPGRLPLFTTVPKRARCAAAATASASAAATSPASTPAAAASSSLHGTGASTASSSSSPAHRPFTGEEVASLAHHVPKRLKKVADKVATGQVSTTEKIFSVVDVREIVESVLADREAKLKEEYTRLLNDRLAEQFRDFTKFNEDHVARHFRGKDFAYLS